MNNIIELQSRRQGKSEATRQIINYCLSKGQPLIIGCSNRESKYNELRAMFPDAELEIVGLGVKIWKKK